jgi:hypothetical protein
MAQNRDDVSCRRQGVTRSPRVPSVAGPDTVAAVAIELVEAGRAISGASPCLPPAAAHREVVPDVQARPARTADPPPQHGSGEAYLNIDAVVRNLGALKVHDLGEVGPIAAGVSHLQPS